MILVFDILKFVLAGGALYFGLTDRAPANHVDSLNTALFVFGVVLATHETYFLLVSIAKAAWKAKSLSCGIARVIASMAWSGTDVGPRSALEGERQLMTWLVSVSGVVIGLIGFNKGPVPDIEKIGAGALVASILSGILYMNILAGGISAESETTITVEALNSQESNVLLGISYWAFFWGVLTIFFGLFASS